MKYQDMVQGIFLGRPNRFIAEVIVEGKQHTVHVKNTGRCREILIKGTKVYLQESDNPKRKTRFSLISACKGDMLINIDSQVPNKVVYDAFKNKQIEGYEDIVILKREKTYGNSRFDLYYEREDGRRGFVEVKGVTLEKDGISMFPDAPTERGRKHLLELVDARKKGYECAVFFLIQINDIQKFTPNSEMDPRFADALKTVEEAGVDILVYNSKVSADEIKIDRKGEYSLDGY
ncbi:sugar fermentation stimulation protein A [Dethiosulfatibacter aminovorans DSM 17477]|uniref:Sugar fermentation stimulation protein homolog n=1 Tax=Dethiosulfatibacter aminovorans DSM 17477 TaxID=1121476 RepID=A0A1M6IRI9_9FIRM|nr:DNA/RNA nuclease SfsA [Dethiosulfatibacter aminovorans]SHJ37091.1 sugar fermentation stimulation protein A [Dethiosulfatibacter aminovorans DSM 17477]